MGFLARFGAALLKGIGIVSGLAPIIQNTNPNAASVIAKVESELVSLADEVTTVEAIGQALNIHGTAKVTAVGPLVAQVVLKSALMVNKKIADPAKFKVACENIGAGIADLLNSLHEDAVKTDDKA